MLPSRVSNYLMKALENSPELFSYVLTDLSEDEADRRPDPDRFTIREALAHVADWENVFRLRLIQTRDQDQPILQGYDEGQWAIDNDYAHSDWRVSLAQIVERRQEMNAVLRGLAPSQWERAGNHTELGLVSIETQAVMISAHDHYHLQQIVAWRKSA